MSKLARLESLRLLSGLVSARQLQREYFPFSRLNSGLPRGAISEFSGALGSGKTEFILNFLAENPKLRSFWVEDMLSIYPRSFPSYGVTPERVLFTVTDRNWLWSLQQAIRSQLFDVFVLSLHQEATLDAKALRKLQLEIHRTQASLLILSPKPLHWAAWALTYQCKVHRLFGIPQVQFLKPHHLSQEENS